MTLIVDIPADLEKQLRIHMPDLPSEAREAMLIEFYRQDQITRYQLSQALGLARVETDAVLKKHHVTEDLPTSDELAEDLRRAMTMVNR